MYENIFLLCVNCDLYLGDMTSSQGHDTPLGNGQQLYEILSRSKMAVRSYVCTVTLTFETPPWVKIITHPCVMDNISRIQHERKKQIIAMWELKCNLNRCDTT